MLRPGRHNGSVSTNAADVRSTTKDRLRVLVLGSTGSIGTQALEVIAANPDRFEVVGWPQAAATRTCWPASARKPA